MFSGTAEQRRVTWITNYAAPYRKPVWEALGATCELQVQITGRSQSRDGRVRGEDWFSAASGSNYELVIPHMRVVSFRGREFRLLRASVSRRVDAVVIGGWEQPIYWQTAAGARAAGARTIGFYESTASSQRFRTGPVAAARKRFFRRLDAVVVPGPAACEAVLEMGVSAERIYEGFNAIDVARFYETGVTAARQGPGHRFLYLGQLVHRKNVDSVIQSFASIRSQHDHLSIVGEGEAQAELLSLVQELSLESAVSFHPMCQYSEIPEVMTRHHTLVLASRIEVWGLVVNEALASGMSVVVSDKCGVSESVAAMSGVRICGIDRQSISDQMAASRRDWTGTIEDPQILHKTPELFAEVFEQACFPVLSLE